METKSGGDFSLFLLKHISNTNERVAALEKREREKSDLIIDLCEKRAKRAETELELCKQALDVCPADLILFGDLQQKHCPTIGELPQVATNKEFIQLLKMELERERVKTLGVEKVNRELEEMIGTVHSTKDRELIQLAKEKQALEMKLEYARKEMDHLMEYIKNETQAIFQRWCNSMDEQCKALKMSREEKTILREKSVPHMNDMRLVAFRAIKTYKEKTLV